MTVIAAERCLSTRDLSEPRLVGGGRAVVYVVSEAGESRLVHHPLDGGAPRSLDDRIGVRAARGLGGGAWAPTPDGRAVVHVGGDLNLWWQPLDGSAAHPLTLDGPDRGTVSPVVSPDGASAAYVVDLAEVHVVDLGTRRSRRVDDGSDEFVIDPSWSADGALHWVAWSPPDMPWDHTSIRRVIPGGRPERLAVPNVAHQLSFAADGAMFSVRDDSGWLVVHRDGRAVVDEPFEHAGPTWGPGQRTFALSPDSTALAFARNERGFGRLCVTDILRGHVQEVARGVHGQLSWSGNRLAAVRTGARTPSQVVVYDTQSWARTVVAVGPQGEWHDDELVEPELVEVPAAQGTVHARLYRAAGAGARLIVWLHGGPTDQWQVTWMPRIAFWRSRGWNVLVPDHRGSTGHGRDYQQALRGRWGELDVADTVAATRWAHVCGLGVPSRTVLFGSSAGGFTALGAVAAAPDAFAAAAVLYPVTDLVDLAERSHRFERHYTDTLVGPRPVTLDVLRERSPSAYAHRFARTPLLVLHGDTDPVVPVEQSRDFVDRVVAAGGTAELHVFEGEGHGFRQRANQLEEYRRVEEFLSVVGD